MNVRIIATHNCSHYQNLERELKELAIAYEVLFVEEHPEIAQRYGIWHPALPEFGCRRRSGVPPAANRK